MKKIIYIVLAFVICLTQSVVASAGFSQNDTLTTRSQKDTFAARFQTDTLAARFQTDTLVAAGLQPYGRYLYNERNALALVSSAAHFGFSFQGDQCAVYASVENPAGHGYIQYELDGHYERRVRVNGGSPAPVIIKAGGAGTHVVWIYKATEATMGAIVITKVVADHIKPVSVSNAALIEFIGNSITCGAASDTSAIACGAGEYLDYSNAYMAYGPRVARALGVNYILSSVSGIGVYRTWNRDGPSMPQVYENTDLQLNSTQQWDFSKYRPRIVSIALGTNDLSNGDGKTPRKPFEEAVFISNYVDFVKLVKSKYPKAQIALLSSPMVKGAPRGVLEKCLTVIKERINAMYPKDKPVETFFFPPMDGQGCSGHPSVEQHRILAEELKPFLQALFIKADAQIESVAAGVKKISSGVADKFTPYGFCEELPMKAALSELPEGKLPFNINDIRISSNDRGVVVEIPLGDSEKLYGFGLQLGSFGQLGLKIKPIVNDNPLNDLGYTHGPATFYVSNKGYGILINTARYTTFYCGNTDKLSNHDKANAATKKEGNSVQELYQSDNKAAGYVTVDIPGAKGVEVFVFEGPDLKNVMQRYNLFAGGGALPAIWGLGIKYRVKADFNQQQVGKMAAYFRNNQIPCDVLGIEPKWQTAAYSCSYVWNAAYFPSPDAFIDTMRAKGFQLNLWEHAFVSPVSPLYEPLKTKAGNYLVWNGLVPDFADTAASSIFANYHENAFVKQGISGFKMDECDNSNIAFGSNAWSFPELSQFPSGIDGEQMHQLFGLLYQKTIYKIYKKRNLRTYLDVRASNDFASSYPSALYSDTYDHKQYIRLILNSGFSGMNWSPEVRESNSIKDFMRRSQTAVLSAQTLYNSWYLQNPPWLQINVDKNNAGELMDNAKEVEAAIRTLLNFRMSLVPYLYNAFADYHYKGIPPFRALVMDYPDDKKTFDISDEYMIGNSILAAPLTELQDERTVYFPEGSWYDYNTNQKYTGGKEYTIKTNLTQLPIFIKSGTILPVAKPVEHIAPDTKFEITCFVYGSDKAGATLFEDDGISFNYEKGSYNILSLSWENGKGTQKRTGPFKNTRYVIKVWKMID